MPQYPNRDTELKRLQQQFDFLLDDLGMKTDARGNERTIYSLRHTSIMFRLLNADGIDMLTLARNARTSVEMIERFYASELTGEMNIDVIQSQRKSKNKPEAKAEVPDKVAADKPKAKRKVKAAPVSPSAISTGNEVLNLPASSVPPLSLS